MRRDSSRKMPRKFILRASGLVALLSASSSVISFGLDQFEERLIEGLHAVVGAGLDGGGKFVEQVLLDEFCGRSAY
jgi:hypothetical protein